MYTKNRGKTYSRKFHSTKTAIARILSVILTALDRGDVAALALVDWSAAFDTVGHCILLRRLRESFGIRGTALEWIVSYLTDRKQCVRLSLRWKISNSGYCRTPSWGLCCLYYIQQTLSAFS